jgi:cytochrome c553
MSHAHNNLAGNPLYGQLMQSIIGKPVLKDNKVIFAQPDAATKAEACYYCHGTKLKVSGFETRDTDAGELEFPIIEGWPNQGVGRINLDGSLGSCSACHTRHTFSIEMARKPYTCKECHVGPDVPAFKVYTASKHGNIFSTMEKKWNFKAVPWTIGEDFTAPTCATCHISLLVNTDGEEVQARTHQMNNRLPWRIYGLIYAHPHPIEPDTTSIRNKDGLPLPTDFDGGTAAKFLIDTAEIEKRTQAMQASCTNCHDSSWIRGHWERFQATIQETNASTLTGTRILRQIWQDGLAKGLASDANPFDEAIEKKWSNIWLLYSNTIRFASAMAGGGDYGVFAGGRYQLSKQIQEISDWYDLRSRIIPSQDPGIKKITE